MAEVSVDELHEHIVAMPDVERVELLVRHYRDVRLTIGLDGLRALALEAAELGIKIPRGMKQLITQGDPRPVMTTPQPEGFQLLAFLPACPPWYALDDQLVNDFEVPA